MYDGNDKLILSNEAKDKILNKIITPRNKNECWESNGTHDKNGYSMCGLGYGFSSQLHRIIYELIKGKIDDKLELDHLCKNTGCVNPDHLEAVTHRENVLRGNHSIMNKGYCRKGHILNKDNIYVVPSTGHIRCRKCIGMYHPKIVDKHNRDKTRCKRGHEFNEKNTYIRKNNSRQCKKCVKLRNQGLI